MDRHGRKIKPAGMAPSCRRIARKTNSKAARLRGDRDINEHDLFFFPQIIYCPQKPKRWHD
jgi:hypothetical protein